ncbi:hypothetical protein P3T40_003096 [Paraburkholderia sp. EB58]|jgi:hypothetical protein|uniref:hypothetical protein n=1 Tax=Paraburkholderia sp. EB58 TaxID=3035125 RepID=UPI003D21D67B
MTTTGRGIVTLCLAACCVCTANAYEDTGAVADRIQSAGRGAHLGHELCGYTSAQVADYKERLRRSLSAPAGFDTEWDYGWKRAEPMLLQYQSLRVSDPQDYESRVRLVCATLRSLARRLPKPTNHDAQPSQ